VLRIIAEEGRRSILANRILIVEDERTTAEDLEEVLKESGISSQRRGFQAAKKPFARGKEINPIWC
jgi:PleD family two-component response regulator